MDATQAEASQICNSVKGCMVYFHKRLSVSRDGATMRTESWKTKGFIQTINKRVWNSVLQDLSFLVNFLRIVSQLMDEKNLDQTVFTLKISNKHLSFVS